MPRTCSLYELDLSQSSVSDAVAIKLSTYTSSLPSLKELNLRSMLVKFLPKLLSSKSALESLSLSRSTVQDGAVVALTNVLAENRTLAQLDLHSCDDVTAENA